MLLKVWVTAILGIAVILTISFNEALLFFNLWLWRKPKLEEFIDSVRFLFMEEGIVVITLIVTVVLIKHVMEKGAQKTTENFFTLLKEWMAD